MDSTFSVTIDEYTISGSVGEPPATYSAMLEHASFHDDRGIKGSEGTALIVTVKRASDAWPAIVISLRFDPGPLSGFHPGAMLIPERHLLLVGAGTTLLAYDLRAKARLWEDTADLGFWRWERHGDIVFMLAELELAAWNLNGRKLWSTFVEPPWDYTVVEGTVSLDVMGRKQRFPAATGPHT